MSFASYLHAVQNKPEPARRRILYGAVALAMLMIISIWAAHFRAGLLQTEAQATHVRSSPFTEAKLLFLESAEAARVGWKKFNTP